MELQFKDRSLSRGLIHGLLAGLAGVVGGLAQAPFSFWPLLFVSLPALVWLLDQAYRETGGGRRWRAQFGLGWWWGFGYLGSSLWWVGNALLVDADQFAWALPFAMIGLPAGLAIFYGLASLAALPFWRTIKIDTSGQAATPLGISRLIGLAVSFALFDWLRSFVLTGFPWNSLYQSLGGHDPMMQAASLIGPWGLGLVIILAALLPATMLDRPLIGRTVITSVAVSLGLVGGLYLYGAQRLSSATDRTTGLMVQIVQPNIAQKDKWRRDLFPQHTATLLNLSKPGPDQPDIPTAVIWPEVAVPYNLVREDAFRQTLGHTVGSGNILITGAFEFALRADGSTAVYNGITMLDDQGRIIDTYRKHHLVPFGEYLPLKSLLAALGMRKLTEGVGDLMRGEGPRTLALETAQGQAIPSVSPQVCYEAIFPQEQVGHDQPRPRWLVNVTNDAWYGDTPGPRQHVMQARFRAVEQGLPVARAANTGISALIDPYGRVIEQLDLNSRGVIKAALPDALPATTYARFGDVIFLIFALLSALISLTLRRKRI